MTDRPHRAFRGVFDTFAELARMREQLTRDPGSGGRTPADAWVPVVDIYAQGEDIVIRCELAGVPREAVELSFCGGQLWISGERSGAPDGDDIAYYVRERRYGPFRRVINLPPGVEADRVEASIEDGLLEIVIRGGAGADHERIEIAGADSGPVRLDVAADS